MNTRSIRIVVLALLVGAIVVNSTAIARAEEVGGMITINPQMLKFAAIPNLPSCALAASLRGDPAKAPFVLIVKQAAGCRIPWHWHTASEQLLAVSGTGILETKDGKPLVLRQGAYAYLPTHHVHQASCSTPCQFFIVSDGAFDIHYVDQSGAEITADQASKRAAHGKTKKK